MIFQAAFSTSSAGGLINALQQYGFVDLLIPFVLIFAVLFAILQKVGIFGGAEGKKYNVVISVAIALLIVIPHALSPNPGDAVSVINRFLPEFVFISIALLILLVLVGLVGGGTKVSSGGGLIVGIASVLAVIYLAIVILSSASPNSNLPAFLSDPNFQAIIIVILVLGLVIYYIGGDDTNKLDFGKLIKNLFGGGEGKSD